MSPDAPEKRKLIESIYPKNNNYLLIDRAYDDDKTLALDKNHGFRTVVPPKKIISYLEAKSFYSS